MKIGEKTIMKSRIILLTLIVLALTIMAVPAYAVIPNLVGPLQALLPMLGQILAFALASIVMAWTVWKMWFSRIMKRKGLFAAIVSGVVLVVVGFWLMQNSGNEAIVAAGSAEAETPTANTWGAFRGGLKRTGNIDGKAGPSSSDLVWAFSDPKVQAMDFSSSPAVIKNRIYVGSAAASVFSSSGNIYCIGAKKAKIIWKFPTEKQVFSSPSVAYGKVYVGEGLHHDYDCNLYCIDKGSGELLWLHKTTSHVESSPFVVDGKVFFGAGDDGVYCLDAESGDVIWHREGIHVDGSPAVWFGAVYFGTAYGESVVYCLDAETGNELWKTPTDYHVWGSPAIAKGKVYFGIGSSTFAEESEETGGGVICLDARTGEQKWFYDVKDTVLSAVSIAKGKVVFGAYDGFVHAISADSGELKWKREVGSPILSSTAVVRNNVYAAPKEGYIYCLDLDEGSVKWKYDISDIADDSEILSSPAIANGKLYIGLSRKSLLCIGKK